MQIRLNLGSGKKCLNGYVNVDLYSYKAEITDDIATLFEVTKIFGLNSIEKIYSSHSLMCIPERKLLKALKIWKGLLKEDGILIIETTDFEKQVEEYIKDKKSAKNVMYSLFGNNKDDGLGLRYQFDFDLLNYWLEKAGFRDIERIKQPEYSSHNEEYNLCVKGIK